MGLKRTPNWATGELHAFLLQRAEQPFAWGKNDCCLFPADAIKAFTGVDIAKDFRGGYTTPAGAFALIRKLTGSDAGPETLVGDAAEYCAKQAGIEDRPFVKLAARGDLLVMEAAGRLIAGIVHLNGREGVSVGEDGLKLLPIEAWRRAWRV